MTHGVNGNLIPGGNRTTTFDNIGKERQIEISRMGGKASGPMNAKNLVPGGAGGFHNLSPERRRELALIGGYAKKSRAYGPCAMCGGQRSRDNTRYRKIDGIRRPVCAPCKVVKRVVRQPIPAPVLRTLGLMKGPQAMVNK